MEQQRAEEINGEAEVHSFIIRMWLEEVESRRVARHGQITYVHNGEVRYFKSLREIPEIIRIRLNLDGE